MIGICTRLGTHAYDTTNVVINSLLLSDDSSWVVFSGGRFCFWNVLCYHQLKGSHFVEQRGKKQK